MADNAMMPTADDESSAPEQICVTITAVGDGTYTVAMGPEADAAEEPASEEASDAPHTAASLEDALKVAGEMFSAEDMEGESDGNEPMAPADAKSYWNQMSSKKKMAAM